MTGIVLLDVAIGVFFALLIYSLAATTIQEAVSSLLNLRGHTLRKGLYRLVTGERGARVMAEAPVKALHGPGTRLTRSPVGSTGEMGRLPSSIPSLSFAKALLQTLSKEYDDLKKGESPIDEAIEAMKTRIADIEIDEKLRGEIATHLAKAKRSAGVLGTVDDALKRAGEWLDALDLPPDDRAKVEAVLDRIKVSDGTLKESVPAALQALKDGIGALDLEAGLKKHLTEAVGHVEDAISAARAELVSTVERLEAEIAHRFDTAMDRVIGWYVRKIKLWLFAIGFALAAVTNFNVLGYAGDLVRNDELRAKILVHAELFAQTGRLEASAAVAEDLEEALKNLRTEVVGSLDTLNRELGSQGVALGWSCGEAPYGTCVWERIRYSTALLSWLIIGLACTMGGQFWYDALKKLMRVRSMVAGPAQPPAQPPARPPALPAGANGGGGRSPA